MSAFWITMALIYSNSIVVNQIALKDKRTIKPLIGAILILT